MKKLIEKDKILRKKIENIDKQYFILKAIYKNFNFITLIRWNSIIKLTYLVSSQNSRTSLVNRCVVSVNKKRVNKLTNLSRHIFLKSIRFGKLNGMKKSSW